MKVILVLLDMTLFHWFIRANALEELLSHCGSGHKKFVISKFLKYVSFSFCMQDGTVQTSLYFKKLGLSCQYSFWGYKVKFDEVNLTGGAQTGTKNLNVCRKNWRDYLVDLDWMECNIKVYFKAKELVVWTVFNSIWIQSWNGLMKGRDYRLDVDVNAGWY
jgi:hypothetical protein